MDCDPVLFQRINRAVNFAHLNCSHDIRLDELAEVACLSKFHFSRRFAATLGETPIQFLHRLRLERSARQLVYMSGRQITEVALSCGFSSSQVFSRAFQRHFNCSPSQFRTDNQGRFRRFWHGRNARKDRQRLHALGFAQDGRPPKARVAALQPKRVAYLRNYGHYGPNPNNDQLFHILQEWARQNGLWTQNARLIGVAWDNPNITPDHMCRYDVCIELPKTFTLQRGIVSAQTLPGGQFNCLHVDGILDDFLHVWEWFTDHSFREPTRRPGHRPSYEFYHPRSFDAARGYVCVDLCLPVQ